MAIPKWRDNRRKRDFLEQRNAIINKQKELRQKWLDLDVKLTALEKQLENYE